MRSAAAWTLAALVLAWTLVRLLGLERGWPLVPLMAFTPYAALAAVAVAVAVAALRRWAAAVVAAACAAVLLVLLAPRGLAETDTDAPGVPLRVLTVNLATRVDAIPDLFAVVRRERVDILSVQELDPALAQALAAAGVERLLPERVLEPRPGFAGTGLYARVPLRPVPGPRDTQYAQAAAAAQPRGAAVVQVVSVHAAAPTGSGAIGRWRHDLRALPRPAARGPLGLLVGDFNATLDHRELRRLLDAGYADAAEEAGQGLHATWPAGRRLPPWVTIDHVLADRRIAVRSARVLRVHGTDHRAVLAELVLPHGR